MIEHDVTVWRSAELRAKHEELAYKIAEVAADRVALEPDVMGVVIDRIIDNYGVAIASVDRRPVMAARAQAEAHPCETGAQLIGVPGRSFHPAWAGWANAVAVRELDFHDSFFGLESGHPGDAIAPILAVAQHMGCSGLDLVHGITTSYEIQIDLCKGISLNKHNIDHVGHLAPGVAAGIGAMLRLPTDVIYQAVQQAVHTSYATRQSRRGMMSSWKCYACAHAGKLAVEAIDRAMRGETSPSPIYEGEASVMATMLDGPDAKYRVPLPEKGEPKRAILESFTKEHSAAYHGQAIIDLAFNMRHRIPDTGQVERITYFTKRLGHKVTGTGSNDPQKMDPNASRETLDHSLMFMFAVALQDGTWHHEHSYAPSRVHRPDTVELWQKISTVEDPEWNRRYDDYPYAERAQGGRAEITLKDGSVIVDEIHAANAHPAGCNPFARKDYVSKFHTLTASRLEEGESERFLALVQKLPELDPADVLGLNVVARQDLLERIEEIPKGLL
jgi:2-methylcitrate dehydratase